MQLRSSARDELIVLRAMSRCGDASGAGSLNEAWAARISSAAPVRFWTTECRHRHRGPAAGMKLLQNLVNQAKAAVEQAKAR